MTGCGRKVGYKRRFLRKPPPHPKPGEAETLALYLQYFLRRFVLVNVLRC